MCMSCSLYLSQCTMASSITDGIRASAVLVSSPLPTSLPSPSDTLKDLQFIWILIGAIGGGLLLIGMVVFCFTLCLVKIRRRKKTMSYSLDKQAKTMEKQSKKASLRYVRNTQIKQHSINSHVTVARTESGQHNYVQVVNRGYLLNQPVPSDAEERTDNATKQLPILPNLTEEDAGEGDNYTEIAFTSGFESSENDPVHQKDESPAKTDVEFSQSIAFQHNVAYGLDENERAIVNTVLQAKSLQSGPCIPATVVPRGEIEPQLLTEGKPINIDILSLGDSMEESHDYDHPFHPPVRASAPTAGQGVYYNTPRDLPTHDAQTMQQLKKPNTSESLNRNEDNPYYNQAELRENSESEAVIYYNQTSIQGDAEEAFYANQAEINDRHGEEI